MNNTDIVTTTNIRYRLDNIKRRNDQIELDEARTDKIMGGSESADRR